MKRSAIWRPLACLLAVLLLTLSLPSCTGKVLYQVTVDDLTYTLRGVGEHVEQITVTRDGKRVGSYQKRGIKGELGGESYGFFVSDLNFDGHLDITFNDIDLDDVDNEMVEAIKCCPDTIADLYAKTEFRAAYKEILRFASIGNTYLEKTAPWSLIKNGEIDKAKKVLYLCLNMAKSLAIVASPIMPNRTAEIWQEQLNFAGRPDAPNMWEEASKIDISKNHKINQPKPLFARLDDETIERYKEQLSVPFDLKDLKG